ncbi:hypothetical protein JCM10207_000169 [Rhodosporidiobolus poonsookiae]
MSWSNLPTELKDRIVDIVDEQGKQHRNGWDSAFLLDSPDTPPHDCNAENNAYRCTYGVGLRVLSFVSKELRALVMPRLFVHGLKRQTADGPSPSAVPTALFQHIIRWTLTRDLLSAPAEDSLRTAFLHLTPHVTTINVRMTLTPRDEHLPLPSDIRERLSGMSAWEFSARADRRTIRDSLRINPSAITSLSFGMDYPIIHTRTKAMRDLLTGWADDDEHTAVVQAVQACSQLERLSLSCGSRLSNLHPAWRGPSQPLFPHLAHLTLAVGSYTPSVHAFFRNVSTHLTSLDLTIVQAPANIDLDAYSIATIPRLRRLELELGSQKHLISILPLFTTAAPSLASITALLTSLDDPYSDERHPPLSEVFSPARLPSLRRFCLALRSGGPDRRYAYNRASTTPDRCIQLEEQTGFFHFLAALRYALAARTPAVACETAWPAHLEVDATDPEACCDEVEDVLAWASDAIKLARASEDVARARELMQAVRGLVKTRALIGT